MNVIPFPESKTKITPKELLDGLAEAIEAGEVEHLAIVTMGKDTVTHVALTSSPAHILTYMNQFQRLEIERLMRKIGMIE